MLIEQDTVGTYLAGWPDASADTIAGRNVAVNLDRQLLRGTFFTSIDGVPTEVVVSVVGSSDALESQTIAVAELVLGAIG